MKDAPNLTQEEIQCMTALAYLEEEPELVTTMCNLPPDWQPIIEQCLVVAYWVGHHQANKERLAELDKLEAEWIAKLGH